MTGYGSRLWDFRDRLWNCFLCVWDCLFCCGMLNRILKGMWKWGIEIKVLTVAVQMSQECLGREMGWPGGEDDADVHWS